MNKIGLTGGIASGKSTVLSWLSKKGIASIDADVVAREVVEPGSKGLDAIVETFGSNILKEDGTLDRPKLGSIVFANPHQLEQLNAILSGLIRQRIHELAQGYEREGKKGIIYDIPLMIEAKWFEEMDEVWLVYVNEATQIQRLMNRNDYSREEALSRIKSQMPIEEKKSFAHVIIDNNGNEADLIGILEDLWSQKHGLFE